MGRRLFDLTNGWNGKPPFMPPFLLSLIHSQTWKREGTIPYTFVNGLEAALEQAQQVAGDKNVVISSANLAQQCISMGVLGEIDLDLVPFVLGDGVPLFANLGGTLINLEVLRVVPTPHVTHIAYRIVK